MKISIIMSIFNDKVYLKDCLESIRRQTFTDWECILIDDGSTDGSSTILQQYADMDMRFKVIRLPENKGLAGALNVGISKAQGEFIARHDGDDIMLPNRLEEQYAHLMVNPSIDVLGSHASIIDEKGNVTGRLTTPAIPSPRNIMKVNPVIHPSVLIRKSVFEKYGAYNEKLRRCQDYDLWFRFMKHNVTFANLEKELLLYRITDKSYTKKRYKYRIYEAQILWNGLRLNKIPLIQGIYILKPLIVGLIPKKFYENFQRFYKFKRTA
ncbi:glycosyltransferase family 2 protein [Paenibacillus chitinolyticus]|uniref:glycosyltransferase family 2 protein n=1 Tax=Paenibacillus chitinolyticus TaxID=79263 RepID=UPI0036DAC0AB